MKQGNPFKRAILFVQALTAQLQGAATPGQLLLANGGYQSRGKGEGCIGNKRAKSSFKQNKRRGL